MAVFNKADILLPQKIDYQKWSVVACDQYTSEKEYWDRVKATVGDAPSALNIVYPEVYLSEGNERIEKINSYMEKYLSDGIFKEYKESYIYVERTLSGGRVRRGLIGTVDLEEYDFSKGSKSKIRATEGTVAERIPPRVKIRENAPLELPHAILLIDDKEDRVIPKSCGKEPVYDFELMENGGHIKGYVIDGDEADEITERVEKYASDAADGLVFAVGDGNHSLATAKTCWENLKKSLSQEEQKHHPARFCLVEIENIYDEALEFEPIHRVLFDVNPKEVLENLNKFSENGKGDKEHTIRYVYSGGEGELVLKRTSSNLAVGAVQRFIDKMGYNADYIHGNETAKRLGSGDNAFGFILSGMEKESLFETVIKDGALPRKTFSMGEAHEKRFYIEAKKIK